MLQRYEDAAGTAVGAPLVAEASVADPGCDGLIASPDFEVASRTRNVLNLGEEVSDW
ncbi:MAG: hypothetical protein GY953_13040 [bacterium]|nr:hypothetical protein [bacterium]